MRNTNLIVWNTRNHCSNPLFLHFLWFFSIFWRLGVTLLPPPPIPSFNHFLQIFTLIRKLLINVNYCQQQGSAGAKQLQFLSCCCRDDSWNPSGALTWPCGDAEQAGKCWSGQVPLEIGNFSHLRARGASEALHINRNISYLCPPGKYPGKYSPPAGLFEHSSACMKYNFIFHISSIAWKSHQTPPNSLWQGKESSE